MADRALVMKDGVIAHEIRIDLARPRDLGHADFSQLGEQLLSWLGVRGH